MSGIVSFAADREKRKEGLDTIITSGIQFDIFGYLSFLLCVQTLIAFIYIVDMCLLSIFSPRLTRFNFTFLHLKAVVS